MLQDSDLAVSQKDAIKARLIKVVAAAGVCLGVVTTSLHLIAGEFYFVLAWASLAILNIFAFFSVDKRLDLAAKLFICSMLIPVIGINLLNMGAGPGVYLAIPGLITCAWAMTTTRFALYFGLSLTVTMLAFLSYIQIYHYDSFSKNYRALEENFYLNISMCMIFVAFTVSSAVYSLKQTYIDTQKELLNEKDSANMLRKKIAESFEEKSELLDMALHMQQLGKVYGLVYSVDKDELSQPSKDGSNLIIGTLDEANAQFAEEYGDGWIVIPLVRQALEDGKNWSTEYEITDRKGGTYYLRARGDVVMKAGVIEKIIIVINDITETSVLNHQLSLKANTDDLTGVLSRRRFEEVFEQRFELSRQLGPESMYIFMDLDRFKIVNDTSGHAAGDALLKEVGKILCSSIREEDIVGRLGGDEFGIILNNCRYEEARGIAESIRSRIEDYRFSWSGLQHRVEACLGVVAIDATLGSSAEIQALADAACYRAKHKGRNRVESVIDDETSYKTENTEKLRLNQIDEALENGLISLFYQEIVPSCTDGLLLPKREILIRLYDKERDCWIMPIEFLSVAERYNRSSAIDKWVVSELVDMLENIEQEEQCEYWVNLSAQSISDPRFAESILEILARAAVEPGSINFEITETSAIVNLSSATNMMKQLRQFGCRFALDDFGVGHASFGSLRTLPVDSVKIDGSFIRNIVSDPADRIFAKSIVEISHAFQMSVTAEYVETAEIADLLREMGVDYLQGYHFSKPQLLAPILNSEARRQAG